MEVSTDKLWCGFFRAPHQCVCRGGCRGTCVAAIYTQFSLHLPSLVCANLVYKLQERGGVLAEMCYIVRGMKRFGCSGGI